MNLLNLLAIKPRNPESFTNMPGSQRSLINTSSEIPEACFHISHVFFFFFFLSTLPFCFQVSQRSLRIWMQWCWCWWQCWTASRWRRGALLGGGEVGGWGLNVLDVEDERWIQTQRNNKTKQKEWEMIPLLSLSLSFSLSLSALLRRREKRKRDSHCLFLIAREWLHFTFSCHTEAVSEHQLSLLLSARHA